MILVDAKHLSVKTRERTILDNISLQIQRGEIITLIGPNGAGKSTLVKCLLGLQKLSAGHITRHPALRVGYMPQKIQLPHTLPMTVKRFLRLACDNREQIIDALELTGAAKLIDYSMHSLSGGEMQRILLTRAILRQPNLLVLDEPVQGVDLAGQAAMYQLITRLRDELNCAVLMISHDLHLVMSSTDTVICLNQHVCCHGHPEKVSNDPAYIELFGEAGQGAVALYTHHHDHNHNLHGDVESACCDHHDSADEHPHPAPNNKGQDHA